MFMLVFEVVGIFRVGTDSEAAKRDLVPDPAGVRREGGFDGLVRVSYLMPCLRLCARSSAALMGSDPRGLRLSWAKEVLRMDVSKVSGLPRKPKRKYACPAVFRPRKGDSSLVWFAS